METSRLFSKNIILLVVLIFLINTFANANKDIPLDQIVGVSTGDVFYYEMYGYFESDDPNLIIDVPPFEGNNTEWVRIEINEILKTTICHTYTLKYFNGSQEVIKGQTSLANDSLVDQDFRGILICSANLKKGEYLPNLPLKINNTLIWTYPEGNREVNYIHWTNPDDFGYCYFDKKTGMLLDLNRTHLYINSKTNQIVRKTDIVKMIQSSLWKMQSSNFLLNFLILILCSALITAYLIKKKITKKNRLHNEDVYLESLRSKYI